MKNDINSRFIVEMKRLQSGAADLSAFQTWISNNYQDLRELTSPGLLIKLKRGGEQQTMKAVMALLPSCSNCRGICEGGNFLTRQEHTACASRVAQAAQNGTLKQVPRPDWFQPDDKHFGPDGYYKCNICDAVWTLVLPEREDNGLWERIA